MTTLEVNLSERLINGKFRIVCDFAYSNSIINKVYA